MATLKHNNLFDSGDRSEVYAILQRDYDRDTRIHQFWHIVLLACAFGAAIFADRPDWLWIFGGLYAIDRSLSRFVDNSNRNWAMHVIDWIEARRD
jgi:hypothetical protein